MFQCLTSLAVKSKNWRVWEETTDLHNAQDRASLIAINYEVDVKGNDELEQVKAYYVHKDRNKDVTTDELQSR